MNDSFHMRLYALTRIACIAWLVKISLVQS